MKLSAKWVTIAKRFARTLGAVVVAALIVKVPDFVGLFNLSASYSLIVVGTITPLLTSADKWLRYGSDPGEIPAKPAVLPAVK